MDTEKGLLLLLVGLGHLNVNMHTTNMDANDDTGCDKPFLCKKV